VEDETMRARDADAVLRAVTGLEDYTIIDAAETGGWLVIDVERTRREAPCPACGTFSGRVKSRRTSLVIDAPAHGRRCRLAVAKRAFRCVTPDCERTSFTETTDEIPTRALSDVRRRRINEQTGHRGRSTDPGWRARHDLLRRSDNLTDNGLSRLADAFGIDTDHTGTLGELAFTWAAKEYLTDLYDNCHSIDHARRQLTWWYCFVAEHPVPELVRLATTISAWETEFLAYFATGATNGRTEGTNRVIKHIKRLGYGFTNTHNYRLRLLYRCRPLPSTPPATAHPAAA
jgi:transposase